MIDRSTQNIEDAIDGFEDSGNFPSPGDARCNFCDGEMPCSCEMPSDEELDDMWQRYQEESALNY